MLAPKSHFFSNLRASCAKMKLRNLLLFLSIYVVTLLACGPSLPSEVVAEIDQLPSHVDYNFHIKPILSDRCYACHGPDELARKGNLRLDIEEAAKAKLESGNFALVEGSRSKSTLIDRILSDDAEYQMPPADAKLYLSARDKAMIIKWIDQGAEYKPHWAFIPPSKPPVPSQQDADWLVKNEIDLFIQKNLKQKNLSPSLPADKEVLLKRVYMDLTGLPPGIDEIDAFLSNIQENAFEEIVDKLLVSDAAAERLAMEWMDVARYADSHGLHADGWRNAWPWRDWVIKAFKENMPYDQFVTEQLAGDLLPDATRDQILATAFQRNHPMTAEGGAIDEEFRLEYVADRTNTTATALMGLTMECARCHDHKFDPISQRDYYAMSAFFNNVREVGMTGDDGNYGPLLQLTSDETKAELKKIQQKIEQLDHEIESKMALIESKSISPQAISSVNEGLTVYLPMETKSKNSDGKSIVDRNKQAYTYGDPPIVDGKFGQAIYFDNEYDEVYLSDVPELDVHTPASASMWINTKKRQATKTQVLIGNAGDKNNYWRGWDFYLEDDNRISFRLISSLPHNLIHVRSVDSIMLNTWTHVAFTYDGSGRAHGAKIYIDGKQVDVDVIYDRLYKNIRTISSGANKEIHRALRISKSYRSFTGDNGIFKGKIDEMRLYNRSISSLEVAFLAGFNAPGEAHHRDHFINRDREIIKLKEQRSSLVRNKIALSDTISEVMVMEEMDTPRPTFVLNRGQYDAPGPEVAPNTPKKILPFPEDLPKNRLGLAKWLFDPDHPLTSRATVNRYWQMIFGRGIVETARDFGNQGALPSHPQLLDWLAIDFIEHNWDLRFLIKQMVLSATYQQSSKTSQDQMELDPQNIYLSRGASYRLPAEMIRDNALAASGLLVRKIGGPSVKPYQPEGLWIEKGTFSHKLLRYIPDEGEGLYRRSLYTFIKRTSPPPTMTIFDVPSRDVCNVTRESTNTPLQALVLLNDPQFVEAARLLAERMLKEGGMVKKDQITYGFRLMTGRKPTMEELNLLEQIYKESITDFKANPQKSKELMSVGDHLSDKNLPLDERAAMTIVGSTLINMDESYMKR